LVSELRIASRVEFRGYVQESIMNELYATCKGHILLSLYEGFGIPVLEALSWRKPSVASNISSLPEVMGSTGILVDPENYEQAACAMKSIADNPTKYLEGIDNQLSKFSPKKEVIAFLKALDIE
jgi:glycosyltransferase involved in cell wall biosynthesis